MNMKKTIGVCVTLLGALFCAVPQSARASGTIRSVDITDLGGVYSFPNVDEPLKVGDTIQIRFHMMNLGWDATRYSAEDAPYEFTNPWMFTYTGRLTGNESLDRLLQIAAEKPRLGLWISGGVREAKCVSELGIASDWLKEKLDNKRHYTDLIFEYTVQPGDLALPIQLANAAGTGPADGQNGRYYLKYENQESNWKIVDSQTMMVTNDFEFGTADPRNDPNFAGEGLSGWNVNDENRDLDLSGSGAYVQAIDFEATYDDPDAKVWRTIAQGGTTPESGVFPTLEIPGGAAKTMNLYMWTADTNIAEIVVGRGQVVSNLPCLFYDGEMRNVGVVRISASDPSVPFFIKATGATNETTQVFLSASPTIICKASSTAAEPQLITNFIARTVKVGKPEQPGISVTVSRPSITASADYNTAGASVDVALRGGVWPGPGELKIPLKVTVQENPSLDVTNYVALSKVDVGGCLHWDTELTVLPNSDSALAPLWLYAKRGTIETEGGLLVEVDTNRMDATMRGHFTGKFVGTTVAVNRSTPVIAEELVPITAEANTSHDVTITVADAYGELRDPCRYTVYWSNSGNDSPAYYSVYSNLTANTAGEITFSVRYANKGDYISRYYVVNHDGKPSLKHEVSVTVTAQKVIETNPKALPRFAENAQHSDPSLRATDVVTLTFGDEGFSMPNGEPAYIFLVPKSQNASNLVDCADFNIEGDQNGRWK